MSNVSDVFAEYQHEDVMFCQVDNLGGLSTEIFYCFLPFIQAMTIPSQVGTNEETGIVSRLQCIPNKGFRKISALIETPVLNADYNSSGDPADTSELTMFLLGTRAELIGLSRKLRDKPFSFIVRDFNNRKFLYGTLASPAYLKSFNITPGKKMDDDNGAELKFRSNAIFYEYNGNIPIGSDETLGDFDGDFHTDFD